jgi:hypothetical protein
MRKQLCSNSSILVETFKLIVEEGDVELWQGILTDGEVSVQFTSLF